MKTPNSFNRTKRNWNRFLRVSMRRCTRLLIAPKGIEIHLLRPVIQTENTFNRTKRNWNLYDNKEYKETMVLLIAPKGIEMHTHKTALGLSLQLLIAPKGIEMLSNFEVTAWELNTFNRTKRNWNFIFERSSDLLAIF